MNQLLAGAVDRFRQGRSVDQRNGLSGLAIFEDEVDSFLETLFEPPPQGAAAPASHRQRIRLRTQASRQLGVELPIENLRQRFDLSDLEVEALSHVLAVELHPGYGRVFGYLNNDLTRQRPTVALIVDVLASNWPQRLEVRRALGPGSALFRFGLLTTRPEVNHFTAELSLDAQALDLLLGGGETTGASNSAGVDDLLVSPAEREAITRITAYLARQPSPGAAPDVVLVSGAPGAGRRTCAEAICQGLRRRLRSTSKTSLPQMLAAQLPQVLRDMRLTGDVPGIYAPKGPSDEAGALPALFETLRASGVPLAFVFVEADAPPRLAGLGGATILRLHLDAPKTALRIQAWTWALAERSLAASEETLARISAVYPFNVGRIHAAAADAALRVRTGAGQDPTLDAPALAQVCREQADHHLERLAEPLPSRHGWDDIILPKDELDRLKEIANAVRNRDRVMDHWGFGQKVSAGPGVNAIFFGPSGTGKTMAASILAGELGMAIFRADLSKVVSKYIGETERNLDALFDEARRSYALLFFDEAEALFGKRSEVKDAHDRYANIEVAYLLQRMERFEGVAILATNLRKHLDNAFLRRLQFAVEFPLPAVAERLRIWQGVWPKDAELGADLDLAFMASHLELSGGHIRNVAMTAAYLASEGTGPIGMRHMLAATRREMQKLGRAVAPEQFGRYAPLLRGVA